MSTPDTYAYRLLKLELRRLDPTNGILAFVEEIEADMVASERSTTFRIQMSRLTEVELVYGARQGLPGYAEECRERGVDPHSWGRDERPPFTPEQEARLREIVREEMDLHALFDSHDDPVELERRRALIAADRIMKNEFLDAQR